MGAGLKSLAKQWGQVFYLGKYHFALINRLIEE